MLEVLDTRLLSVLTWYHLSFLAVSVAMLGMAAGAVLVFVGGELFAPERARPRVAGGGRGVCAGSAGVARRQPRHPIPGGSRRLPRGARRPVGGHSRPHHPVRPVGPRRDARADADARPDRHPLRRRSARRRGRLPRDHLAARADRHHVDGARDRRCRRDRRRVLCSVRRQRAAGRRCCWRSCCSARRRSTPRRIGRSASSIPRAAACGWTSAPSTIRRGTPTPT